MRERGVDRAERVAVLRGGLVVLRRRGLPHPPREVARNRWSPPAMNDARSLGDGAVRLDRDRLDARRRALADVAEQARAPGLLARGCSVVSEQLRIGNTLSIRSSVSWIAHTFVYGPKYFAPFSCGCG